MPRPTPTHCKDCGTLLLGLNSVFMGAGRSHHNRCKFCYTAYQKQWVAENPFKRRYTNLKNKLKDRFNLSEAEYAELIELHQNACAICRRPESIKGRMLAVDHDHKTGKIRGLLCHGCNVALGHLKEDENLIWNMLEYIKKHAEKIAVQVVRAV